METIFAIVADNIVVGGPYKTMGEAEAVLEPGYEIIEIEPADEGYDEFKSFMNE